MTDQEGRPHEDYGPGVAGRRARTHARADLNTQQRHRRTEMIQATPEQHTEAPTDFPHVDAVRWLPWEAEEDDKATATCAVLDIETGPLPDDQLAKLCPAFEPPPHPGEFDPASVKTGNLGQAKAAEKIAAAAETHAQAVARYATDVEAARTAHAAKFKERAALDATTGRVVAIGLLVNGESLIIGADRQGKDRSEDDILHSWWGFWRRCVAEQRPVAGFNIHAFDLPFLVRRSWILGVPIPTSVRQGRYWSPLLIDLMKAWALDGRDMVSLDTLARAFGIGEKLHEADDGQAVSGADFHRLWAENRPAAIQYLGRDLDLTAALAVKMGIA
jgi:hypothetical protein